MARGRRWCSSIAGWAALASGSRSSRCGRRAIGWSRSRPTATAPARAWPGAGASTTTPIRSTPWPSMSACLSAWSGSRGAAQPPSAWLRTQDAGACTQICGLRDRWRARVRAGRWYEAFEEFVDFYNGPGSFARWPPPRHKAFLAAQRACGDTWDVLFDDLLTLDALTRVTAPVHVVEGSQAS